MDEGMVEIEDVDPDAARRREVERLVDGSSALMADDGERARAWQWPPAVSKT